MAGRPLVRLSRNSPKSQLLVYACRELIWCLIREIRRVNSRQLTRWYSRVRFRAGERVIPRDACRGLRRRRRRKFRGCIPAATKGTGVRLVRGVVARLFAMREETGSRGTGLSGIAGSLIEIVIRQRRRRCRRARLVPAFTSVRRNLAGDFSKRRRFATFAALLTGRATGE